MSKKYVYLFTEGNAKMRELLGGKGANLAEMTNIGMPVPQGFTITTEACTQYYEDGRKINDEIMAEIMKNVEEMEKINGKKFGDLENPLLVSVRSGARASMPGMMDTILNLGLNDDVVAAMIKGNPDPKFERFVYDSYRRFIQMFSDVVMEVGKKYFEQLIDQMKERKGVTFDVELTAADLKELAEQFKAEYKKQIGSDFPSDPKVQLYEAIRAVFRSWDNPRANVYRRDNDIPYSWGTAVNVMPMVFGNLNENSGTGVAFTRDPATGEKKLMGEFLTNAQGEDVVAGVRTPMPIAQMEEKFPEAYAEFIDVCNKLEDHYRDMQDMEFTVENGKLYIVYDFIFAVVTRRRIFDLGSGLNLYSTKMLKNKFYQKFPDNLMFNYVMILASHYYQHDIIFYPVSWREDDQVSNVKIASQAVKVLNMAFAYLTNNDVILDEYRDTVRDAYTCKVVGEDKELL